MDSTTPKRYAITHEKAAAWQGLPAPVTLTEAKKAATKAAKAAGAKRPAVGIPKGAYTRPVCTKVKGKWEDA